MALPPLALLAAAPSLAACTPTTLIDYFHTAFHRRFHGRAVTDADYMSAIARHYFGIASGKLLRRLRRRRPRAPSADRDITSRKRPATLSICTFPLGRLRHDDTAFIAVFLRLLAANTRLSRLHIYEWPELAE